LRLIAFSVASAAGLWLLGMGDAPAQPLSEPWGVQAIPVVEGDGKQPPKGAKDKEEAKRNLKSAGPRFKQGMKELGQGIKKGFGEAKEDLKKPTRRPKKAAPSPEGA
jgi:hypothetical protein